MAQGIATPYPDLATRDTEPGRPTRCTLEVIAAVAKHVANGGYPSVALEGLGISNACNSQWLEYAIRDYNAGLDDSVFVAYSRAVKRAQAEWTGLKLKQLESVHRRVADDRPELWASVTTSLERRLPDLYGKRDRQEAPQHTTNVQINFLPFPGVESLPLANRVQVLDVPIGPAASAPDTEDLGHTPPRICEPKDTGG